MIEISFHPLGTRQREVRNKDYGLSRQNIKDVYEENTGKVTIKRLNSVHLTSRLTQTLKKKVRKVRTQLVFPSTVDKIINQRRIFLFLCELVKF